VVDRYLGDNASTDAISGRLRDVCPALYNADDAVADEVIIGVRNGAAAGDDRQREHLLKEAVAMCKRVAASHRLNLEVLLIS
jgi:nuclear pore complex protein Nup155